MADLVVVHDYEHRDREILLNRDHIVLARQMQSQAGKPYTQINLSTGDSETVVESLDELVGLLTSAEAYSKRP